jgi:hypothetical protein
MREDAPTKWYIRAPHNVKTTISAMVTAQRADMYTQVFLFVHEKWIILHTFGKVFRVLHLGNELKGTAGEIKPPFNDRKTVISLKGWLFAPQKYK